MSFRLLLARWLSSGKDLGRRRVRLLAEAGLIGAGIIWGVNFVLVKLALEDMPPLYYLGLRFLVGSVLLAPYGYMRLRSLSVRGWLLGIGVGVLLFAGFVLQTVGLQTTTPAISGFLTNLYVILVPLILGIFTSRWPSPLLAVGILVVSAGLTLLSLYGSLKFGLGEILTLLGTIFWAVHVLGVGYASRRVSAVALVQLQLTTCALLCLACAFAFEQPDLFPGWRAMGAILWTGIMGGIVAYVLMAVGQRYTPATLAGILMSLESAFALIFSVIWGYDTLTLRAVLGFALIFAGTIVARIGSKDSPELEGEAGPPAP
ncbi:MAG: DMT family transporter [Thermoleophilia bacterium]|nr:DMT family transporter [Thermoleophilia bacterium]